MPEAHTSGTSLLGREARLAPEDVASVGTAIFGPTRRCMFMFGAAGHLIRRVCSRRGFLTCYHRIQGGPIRLPQVTVAVVPVSGEARQIRRGRFPRIHSHTTALRWASSTAVASAGTTVCVCRCNSGVTMEVLQYKRQVIGLGSEYTCKQKRS